jgi:hypothetical protein
MRASQQKRQVVILDIDILKLGITSLRKIIDPFLLLPRHFFHDECFLGLRPLLAFTLPTIVYQFGIKSDLPNKSAHATTKTLSTFSTMPEKSIPQDDRN